VEIDVSSSITPSNQTVPERAAALMKCETQEPVTWTKDGELINSEDVFYLENYLIISHVSTLSEGSYTCLSQANNKIRVIGEAHLRKSNSSKVALY